MNNIVSEFKALAGMTISAAEKASLTEAVLHKPDAKKKKVKKANLTEEQKDKKMAKKMMKMKGKAVAKIAKGNKKAHAMCETIERVLSSAKEHFGNKRVAKNVAEAILWKKLHDAKVNFTVTESEMKKYFGEFDTLLETVVDTQRGAKSLHGQYDATIDGNMYKDSKSEADKAGKGEAYKKDEKWKSYNEKARDKGLTDTQDSKGGMPGDRQPVAGQDAAFKDGNHFPSTQDKLGEDASGAKHAVEALGKSEAGGKAKEAVKKAQGGYGSTKEGVDLDFIRKIAGMDQEPQEEIGYMVVEAESGKIECIFPNYQDAVNHVEKLKKAAGKQGYTIDPKKFSKGFHMKGSGDSYTTQGK